MSDKQKVYENGHLSKEIVTNDKSDGSSVAYVQSVHDGALGTTFKTTDAVITTDKSGDVHIKTR